MSKDPPNRLRRLLRTLLLLHEDRCVNVPLLADRYRVSRRTVFRDLATLQDAGVVLVYQPEEQAYRLIRIECD